MTNNKYAHGLFLGLGSGLLLSTLISDFFFSESNSTIAIFVIAITAYLVSWYFGKKK